MEKEIITAKYVAEPSHIKTAFIAAQEIVKRARKKACQVLRNARITKRRAYTLGYERGLAKAEQESKALTIEHLARVHNQFLTDRNELINVVSEDLEEILSSICKAVIGEELRQSKDLARAYLTRATSELLKSDPVKISVNPSDLEETRQALNTIGSKLEVEVDPFLQTGVVRAIFPSGRMELSWQEHLDRLRSNVRHAFVSMLQESKK